MKLQSDTPEFLESFCSACVDVGLSADNAAILLYGARLKEASADPDFVDGFHKQAAGGLLAAGGKVLGGLVAGGGLLAGGSALAGRNPLKHLSGSTSGWGWDRRVHIPSWLGTSQPPAQQPARGNAFGHIDGFATPATRSSTPPTTGPLAEARAARDRLQALDQQAQAVRGRTLGPGLEGTLGARAQARELRDMDLERQRLQRSMVGAYYGGFKGDVDRASRSLAGREQQLVGRRESLGRAATNLQTAMSGNTPWYARPWEVLTGAEGRAQKVLSSQRQLEQELAQLQSIRQRLQEVR